MIIPAAPTTHLFTVDVEEWFDGIPISNLSKLSQASRLELGLMPLLELLQEHQAKATFFILGDVVRRTPELVTRIAEWGQEIACHSRHHLPVFQQAPDDFRRDLVIAKDMIEQCVGREVLGFRAPYFSITKQSLWALDTIAECGFRYDASIFPVKNWRYGISDAPLQPHSVNTRHGALLELPGSVRTLGSHRLPACGGAYFRIYPYSFTASNIRSIERRGEQAIFYIHPWELDPRHPRVEFDRTPHFTHYHRLGSTRPKLTRLLQDFRFTSIESEYQLRTHQ